MIAICTPTRDVVQGTFVYDLIQVVKETPEMVFAMAFGTMVGNLRESLASSALDHGASHVLFIDSDMRFPADVAVRLLAANKHIVGANCRQRSQNETTARREARFITSKDKTGLERVDTLGFGVTLIDAEVFRQLPEPWFASPWDEKEKKLVGEDVYFCTKARGHGFKVWIDHDLSREVRHTGATEFEVN